MAMLKNRPPSYHRHNAFGQAIVTINDRHQHFGNDRSLESQTQDRRLFAKWAAVGRPPPLKQTNAETLRQNLRLNEPAMGFLEHAHSPLKNRPLRRPVLLRRCGR